VEALRQLLDPPSASYKEFTLWSYDLNNLATSEKDQVRMEISDTDQRNQLLQDEEIEQAISVEANFWGAVARCCEIISRQFLRKADVRLGRAMMITYTKQAEQYLAMAQKVRAKALGTQIPYAGGIYIADKVAIAQNTGLVAPAFVRNMIQNPWTGGYSPDALPPTSLASDDPGFVFGG
jgi:hypothetical protein